jgi:hypothetical protein
VEVSAKALRQHRAVLSARQGDPDAPAGGTFYAQRQRLVAELTRSQEEFGQTTVDHSSSGKAVLTARSGVTRHIRAPAAIEEDLRVIDDEIASLQGQIDEIDRQLAKRERHAHY